MTLVVNLYGGPGTGKSTTAAAVFSKLKLAGVNCEMSREFAKDIVWEENFKVLEDTLFVFATQARRLRVLVGQVDVIITDAPILLASVYGEKTGISETLHTLIHEQHNSFNNLDIFLRRQKEYNPAGRMQTEREAKALDRKIRDLKDFDYMFKADEHVVGKIFDVVMEEIGEEK